METKPNNNKKIIIFSIIGAVALCCCVIVGVAVFVDTPAAPISGTQNTSVVQLENTATETQAIIFTPSPDFTATPTFTPEPSPTATNTPAPIVLTGSGDMVVDVAKDNAPAILHAKYTGGSNFVITNFDSSNQQIDLLVNTIGSYEGTLPLDFMNGVHTSRFEIKASGPWELQILPLTQVRHATIPGTIQGVGDDVLYLDGANADLINANANTAKSNFVIYSYSDNGIDLVFNEIAPYSGTAMLDKTTFMISVLAEGNWSIEITTK